MNDNLWEEFLGGDGEFPNSHCGLCGNWGFVDTRGEVFTPAGHHCGVLAWCICPNGRGMKEGGWDIHKTAMRKYRSNG